MRESLRRRCGLKSFDDPMHHRSTRRDYAKDERPRRSSHEPIARALPFTLAVLLLTWSTAWAQDSPWTRAARNLEQAFTGPLARSLALVAIVIGGLMFMFGEGGAKRQISGIVFGGGLALFAAQFLAWLF